jgi:predicted transcriptional regulator of viral defense system
LRRRFFYVIFQAFQYLLTLRKTLKQKFRVMKKTEIEYKIKRFRKEYVFNIDDLKIDTSERRSASAILAQLVKSGKLRRLAKGRYYKPRFGILKELKPGTNEVIKDLLIKGKNPIGYISGYSIFNKLNLTSQLSNTIQIATNQNREPIKRSFQLYF